MNRRQPSRRILAWAGLLGVTACAGPMAGPQIRAASNGATAPLGSVAKGRFLLDQGQYGLAIDEFRKALRTDPDNVASVEGLARSYDSLGRADLSDRYYQQALALAPRDPQIYRDYAESLRRHGRAQDAALLEADFRAVENPAAATQGTPPPSQGESVARMIIPDRAVPAPYPAPGPMLGERVARMDIPPRAQTGTPPVEEPYLRRESMTEVRLVTRSAPPPAAPASVTLATAPSVHLRLPTRVVNAVGRRGIATRYVAVLKRNGWPGVEAGDAVFKVERSHVICPPAHCAEAARLAASLPFKVRTIPNAQVSRILVLLGRDALGADLKKRAAERG